MKGFGSLGLYSIIQPCQKVDFSFIPAILKVEQLFVITVHKHTQSTVFSR